MIQLKEALIGKHNVTNAKKYSTGEFYVLYIVDPLSIIFQTDYENNLIPIALGHYKLKSKEDVYCIKQDKLDSFVKYLSGRIKIGMVGKILVFDVPPIEGWGLVATDKVLKKTTLDELHKRYYVNEIIIK